LGLRGEDVTTELRKLQNVELHGFILLNNYNPGDQMNEVGGTCGTYDRRGEVHTGFCWGNLREIDHS
jgi:hypothetical protein